MKFLVKFLLVIYPFILIKAQTNENSEQQRFWYPQFKAVKPLIENPLIWEKWEAEHDSLYKKTEFDKIVSDKPVYFEWPNFDEEDTVIDYRQFNPGSVHFIDYSNDGLEDIIYQEFIAMTYGTEVKLFTNQNGQYFEEGHYFGAIVEMGKDAEGLAWFKLHQYPCCDGYVHQLKEYVSSQKDGKFIFDLKQTTTILQSTMASINTIPDQKYPDSLQMKIELTDDAVVYYRDRRPVYQKFEVPQELKKTFKFFYPFAVFPEGTKGVVLAQDSDKTENADTLFFVKFDLGLQPQSAIKMINWLNLDKNNDKTIFIGWIEQKACRVSEDTK